MLLSKILILSCMIIIYNVEENTFVAIFYKLLVKKKCIKRSYWKLDCLKINGKQRMKLRNYVTKIKSPFIIYQDFESILVPENKSNI